MVFDSLADDTYESYKILQNLYVGEWNEYSDFNLSKFYYNIIEQDGIIHEEKIDNRKIRYSGIPSNKTSDRWFYKPKFRMLVPDLRHPPPELIIKKNGKKLTHQY